jgi:ubiquinone/menaquinone biosynthesis C-methylase UbiE
MRRFLYKIYWRLEARIVPGLRSSQFEYAETLETLLAPGCTWLEVGCGRRPMPEWMPKQQARALALAGRVFGIDQDLKSLKDHTAYPGVAVASGYQMPFPAGHFDVLSANMVVEHIEQPERLLAEVRRLLKPHGRFIFHTPNHKSIPIRMATLFPQSLKEIIIRILENRKSEDVFPTFYRLNSRATVEKAAENAGMRVVKLAFVNSSAMTAVLVPACIVELLWLRRIAQPGFEHWRTNIIGVLEPDPDYHSDQLPHGRGSVLETQHGTTSVSE